MTAFTYQQERRAVRDFSAQHSFDIPGLSNFGITEDHFPDLIARAKKASSMKGNPVDLTDEELTGILQKTVAEFM